jgi:hypothetical protein
MPTAKQVQPETINKSLEIDIQRNVHDQFIGCWYEAS